MSAILIKGGRIVDPASSLDSLRDLRVRDGHIVEIGEHIDPVLDEEILRAGNCVVAPGFIDMHVHLREPGFSHKETLATGTHAAVRGGFSAVACMPNTNPALDDADRIRMLVESARRDGHCHVYPIGAITRERRGIEPCDFSAMAAAGSVAFSDDGDTVEDAAVMREAALLARELRPPFIAHCEPEEPIVARDLHIARETGKSWHFAHLSTAAALDLVRGARSQGVRATCEVTPHHLTFTSALLEQAGGVARVNPPLAGERDVEALRRGVRDGTIDVLASDHAPHALEEKHQDPKRAAPGFSGLEIAVGAYAAALPDLPLMRFVAMLSTNPARILGVPGGSLRIGEPADISIFADRAWTVDPLQFASKGRCTPFAGRRLPRQVLATIVGGTLRYRTERIAA